MELFTDKGAPLPPIQSKQSKQLRLLFAHCTYWVFSFQNVVWTLYLRL